MVRYPKECPVFEVIKSGHKVTVRVRYRSPLDSTWRYSRPLAWVHARALAESLAGAGFRAEVVGV